MPSTDSNAVVNRLFVILNRSSAQYLADSKPWTHAGDEPAIQAVERLVADQRMYAGRVAELLLSLRYPFGYGEYPMAFTDTHELSLDYLIGELIYYHKQDITAIERCVNELSNDLAARALAEEILGNARGHLESLEELTRTAGSAK